MQILEKPFKSFNGHSNWSILTNGKPPMFPFSHSSAKNNSKTNPSINFPISCIDNQKISRPFTQLGVSKLPCFRTSFGAKPFIWNWVCFTCQWTWRRNTFSYEWFRTLFDTEKKPTWEWFIFPCILFSFISICLRLGYSDRKLGLKRTINSQEGAQHFKLPSWKKAGPKPLRPMGKEPSVFLTHFRTGGKKNRILFYTMYIHKW